MKKKLPVGIEDFEEFVTEDFYYVDKTLFIAELRKRCTTPRSDTFSTFCYTLPRGFEAPKYRNAQ